MKRVVLVVSLLLALAGCQKQPPQASDTKHPFTQEELRKKQLDEAFTPFIEALDLESVTDYRQEVRKNSHVRLKLNGTIVYTYVKNGKTLIEFNYRFRRFTADLYGGISLKGSWRPRLSDDLEDYIDADVLLDGEKVATLGFETYEYTESGETVRRTVAVFRFDDGTSYAVRSLLLIEPLIEYLLENVLSTE